MDHKREPRRAPSRPSEPSPSSTAALRESLPWAALAGGLSLVLYLLTAAPTITWRNFGADSGELATAVMTLGIPHPPGYPTYVLVGRLATILLPFGDPAHRLALLSAGAGAVTVTLIVLTAAVIIRPQRMHDRWSLLLAGLALGAAPLLWSQATIAEVYSPAAAALAAALLLMVLRLRRDTAGGLLLLTSGLLLGVGAGLHPDVLFLLIAAVPTLLVARMPRAGVLFGVLGLLLGLSVFLILPVLAARHPPISWGDPVDLPGMLWTLTATPYRSLVFGVPLQEMPLRILGTLGLIVRQFGPVGWVLAVWGAVRLWGLYSGRSVVLLLGILGGLSIVYTLGYNSVDFAVNLIPLLLAAAVCIALGAAFLLDLLAQWRPWAPSLAVVALLVTMPGLSLVANYSTLDLSADREALDYATAASEASGGSTGALLLAVTSEHVFSLWYYRYVHAADDAPEIIAVSLLRYPWYRDQLRRSSPDLLPAEPISYDSALDSLLAQVSRRPIYIAWEDSGAIAERYDLRAAGPLYQVLPPGAETSGD